MLRMLVNMNGRVHGAGAVCAAVFRLAAFAFAVEFVAPVATVVLPLATPPLRDAAAVGAAEVRGRTLNVGCSEAHNMQYK